MKEPFEDLIRAHAVRFVRTHPEAVLPSNAYEGDAGYDLVSVERVILRPHQRMAVNTGFNIAIPDGFVGLVCSRSGLALKGGVFVLNSPGIIDSGYRGPLKVILYNSSNRETVSFEPGARIGQLVLVETPPVAMVEVPSFDDDTERGEAGYGSSGV